MADVLVTEFYFSTPRIIMHICSASMMTPTPSAPVTLRIDSSFVAPAALEFEGA
tara:strand:- start:338 stop:499 length:162 start_codon:yes stop_codon:yes gene_type:complete